MPALFDREKRPARLSESFHHNLSLYALTASAAGVQLLALAQPCEAEIVYTPAHVRIGHTQDFSFDLNHDGTNDFTISNSFSHVSGSVRAHLQVSPAAGGAIVHSSADFGAAALPRGAPIGSKDSWHSGPQVMAARSIYIGSRFTYGGWFNVTNEYLGLRFTVNGQQHYGWARLTVLWNGRYRIVAGLTGYAYETVPDQPILAGDTGGASNEEIPAQPIGGLRQQPVQPVATLALLSLGAPGLAIWRRLVSCVPAR